MQMRHGLCLLALLFGGCYVSNVSSDGDVTDDGLDTCIYTIEDDPLIFEEEPTSRRVLFVVDVSQSMTMIDPPDALTGETRRTRGLRLTIEELLADERYETAISIVRFSSVSQVITYADEDGNGTFSEGESFFLSSNESLLGLDGSGGLLDLLRDSGSSSNYRDPLIVAQDIVQAELGHVEMGKIPEMEILVVVVGDFGLESLGNEVVVEEAILEEARRLASIGTMSGVGLLEVHCAHMAAGADRLDRPAAAFAGHIAEAGLGTARSFDRDEDLDLLFMVR